MNGSYFWKTNWRKCLTIFLVLTIPVICTWSFVIVGSAPEWVMPSNRWQRYGAMEQYGMISVVIWWFALIVFALPRFGLFVRRIDGIWALLWMLGWWLAFSAIMRTCA